MLRLQYLSAVVIRVFVVPEATKMFLASLFVDLSSVSKNEIDIEHYRTYHLNLLRR